MTTDLDIYRTANVLIREHGEDAALEAAQRAYAMLEKGEIDGQLVWKRVLAAVKEIQRQELREREAVNSPTSYLLGIQLNLQDIARQIDGAVVATLEAGVRTPDLGGTATTESLTDAVIAEFRR